MNRELAALLKSGVKIRVAGKFQVGRKQAPRPAKDIPTPGAVRTKRTGLRTIILTEKDILP